jgi:hypothetical protein
MLLTAITPSPILTLTLLDHPQGERPNPVRGLNVRLAALLTAADPSMVTDSI